MSYTVKPLEKLDLMDDFLMNAITSNPDVGVPFCREVLSVLLQREIGDIRIHSQRSVPGLTPEHRGIRMDVEIEEIPDDAKSLPVLNVYDLEPHLQNNLDLPRHNRFYQAKIDSRYLKSGERNFARLPNLYVISITTYDPFGYDYMMYTVSNKCQELPDMDYEDGLQFIYFYTGGSKGGNPQIKEMLQYFQNSSAENATSDVLKKIHRYVNNIKIDPEVELEYMTFEDFLYLEKQKVARITQAESILKLLEDYGTIPNSIKEIVMTQKDSSILDDWLKLAARAESIQDFIDKTGIVIPCTQ